MFTSLLPSAISFWASNLRCILEIFFYLYLKRATRCNRKCSWWQRSDLRVTFRAEKWNIGCLFCSFSVQSMYLTFWEDCLTLTYESFRDEVVCAHNKQPSEESVLNEFLCTLLLADWSISLKPHWSQRTGGSQEVRTRTTAWGMSNYIRTWPKSNESKFKTITGM